AAVTTEGEEHAAPSARPAAAPQPPAAMTAQPAQGSAEAASSANQGAVAGWSTRPASPSARATETPPPAATTSSPPRPRATAAQPPPAATAAEPLARIPVLPPGRGAGTPVPAETETQWESLKAEVLSCTKCALHSTRTQGVFGVGNRRAEWLVIGEAPGAEEDRRGEPFVGRAGQLLNAMLVAIGLPREQVFIANVLKSRPPNNLH